MFNYGPNILFQYLDQYLEIGQGSLVTEITGNYGKLRLFTA
jgi:hypothetical protein